MKLPSRPLKPLRSLGTDKPVQADAAQHAQKAKNADDAEAGTPVPRAGEVQAPPLAGITSPALRAAELRLTLAKAELTVQQAQANTSQGLKLAKTVPTSAALETGVAELLRSCAAGTCSDAQVAAQVDALVNQAGSEALQSLLLVVEQRLPEAKSEVAGAPQQAAFESAASGMLERLNEAAFTAIAARPPPQTPKEAMDLAVARSEALSTTSTSLYASDYTTDTKFHGFTNEPGWPALALDLDVKGGACVGVSGALLDAASMGADLAVSLDGNPAIRDMFLVTAALLLGVDENAKVKEWTPHQQADEVLSRIEGGSTDETLALLSGAGLSGALLERAPDILEGLKSSIGRSPADVWCLGEHAPKRVQHLTELARRGRLVAVTADLADPTQVDRVNALLSSMDVKASHVHLSNALDYIPDVKGTLENLGSLQQTKGCQLTGCLLVSSHEPGSVSQRLGTFDKPASLPASEWLGAEGLGKDLDKELWNLSSGRTMILDNAQKEITGEYTWAGPHPTSAEDMVAMLAQKEATIFSSPELRNARLEKHLARRLTEMRRIDPELQVSSVPPPTGSRDLERASRELELSFWTPKRSTEFLDGQLASIGCGTSDFPAAKELIAQAHSLDDLQAVTRELNSQWAEKFAALPPEGRIDRTLVALAGLEWKKMDEALEALNTSPGLREVVGEASSPREATDAVFDHVHPEFADR